MSDRAPSVYFIRQAPPSAGRVKIGFTTRDPEHRLKDLQTGSGCRLWVAGHVAGEESLEKSIHRRLHEHRCTGEWFRPTPPVIQEVWEWIGDPMLTPEHWWDVGLATFLLRGQPLARSLYALRWPDGSATVVQAASMLELWQCADDLGNPRKAQWARYNGPVAVGLEPNPTGDGSVICGRSGTQVDNNVEDHVEGMLANASLWQALELDTDTYLDSDHV